MENGAGRESSVGCAPNAQGKEEKRILLVLHLLQHGSEGGEGRFLAEKTEILREGGWGEKTSEDCTVEKAGDWEKRRRVRRSEFLECIGNRKEIFLLHLHVKNDSRTDPNDGKHNDKRIRRFLE